MRTVGVAVSMIIAIAFGWSLAETVQPSPSDFEALLQ